MKQIILGSASPRRRELLQLMGIEFEVLASDAEECYQSSVPQDIVKELALVKARNVAELLERRCLETKMMAARGREDAKMSCVLKPYIVIGADTIVVQDGKILGKPKDEADAFSMLKSLQGREHEVYTGVALLECDVEGVHVRANHAEGTKVFVHEMEEKEIRGYIATKEPMDKAGAYGIQGRFAAYIDRIEGDYYNVVGLPLAYLYRQLKQWA